MSADRPIFCPKDEFDKRCANCHQTTIGVCPIIVEGGQPKGELYGMGDTMSEIKINNNGQVIIDGPIKGTKKLAT
jgi:hypothetical protein